jgi:hypothetical protein
MRTIDPIDEEEEEQLDLEMMMMMMIQRMHRSFHPLGIVFQQHERSCT